MKHAHPIRVAAGAFALLLTALDVQGQPARPDCSSNYPSGFPPRVVQPDLGGTVRELCYDGFGVTFSDQAGGPVASSHFMTRARMSGAAQGAPVNTPMQGDPRLPASMRARSSDFARAGYDMIQLTPGAAMDQPAARSATMTMANVVPVQPGFAQGPWASLDQIIRDVVARSDVLYVATGAIYPPTAAQAVKLPSALFKAMYNPSDGWAGAYLCTNHDYSTCQVVSLVQLQQTSGIDVFPALGDVLKQTPPPLPPV